MVARDVAAAASAPVSAAPTGPLNVAVAPPADGKGIQPDADVPVGGMRQTIARRLLESKVTVPHFYLEVEVDAAPLMAMRESLNKRLAEAGADAVKFQTFKAERLAVAKSKWSVVNAGIGGNRLLRYGTGPSSRPRQSFKRIPSLQVRTSTSPPS